jgi:hypothetical protein
MVVGSGSDNLIKVIMEVFMIGGGLPQLDCPKTYLFWGKWC